MVLVESVLHVLQKFKATLFFFICTKDEHCYFKGNLVKNYELCRH